MTDCAPLRDLFAKALWFTAKASMAHLPLETQRIIFYQVLLAAAVVTAQRLDETVHVCDAPKGHCFICLEEFTPAGPAVLEVNPCHHQMHAWCLGCWIGGSDRDASSCPACRGPIRL